jgi:hypothetical protein
LSACGSGVGGCVEGDNTESKTVKLIHREQRCVWGWGWCWGEGEGTVVVAGINVCVWCANNDPA